MQLNLFLGLWVASASALDIWFHGSRGCGGTGLVCSGINPGVCCLGAGGLDLSVSYLGIVQYWDITCSSSLGYNCDDVQTYTRAKGVTYVCHETSIYDSARYVFNGKKRDEIDVCTGAERPCDAATAQRADKLVLEDGTTFDIGGLEDDQWNEM